MPISSTTSLRYNFGEDDPNRKPEEEVRETYSDSGFLAGLNAPTNAQPEKITTTPGAQSSYELGLARAEEQVGRIGSRVEELQGTQQKTEAFLEGTKEERAYAAGISYLGRLQAGRLPDSRLVDMGIRFAENKLGEAGYTTPAAREDVLRVGERNQQTLESVNEELAILRRHERAADLHRSEVKKLSNPFFRNELDRVRMKESIERKFLMEGPTRPKIATTGIAVIPGLSRMDRLDANIKMVDEIMERAFLRRMSKGMMGIGEIEWAK